MTSPPGGGYLKAMADVLFGAYNPTGKLAVTMYPPEFVEQIPLTEMSLTVPPGRTHMYYTGEPEFAFGDGLSYSTFEMASAGAATTATMATEEGASATFEVCR